MNEILPGIYHWAVPHPKIKFEVSSYYLADECVLIDPLVPPEGIDVLPTRPQHILLTNRHHYRDSGRLQEVLGCTVHCVEQGLHEFKQGEKVAPFHFGDTLPGNIEAVEIGAICPDETALFIPRGEGILAIADGVVRMEDGPLGFVPEKYMDDPETVKEGLRASYRRLLDRDFDHLLLAHGWPWVGGGKQALREFMTV
jgi:glyoxylase-like metal-dependent hydrolase (beta-lactamase superfamily II)